MRMVLLWDKSGKVFSTHLRWRCKFPPHASGDPRFFDRREIGRCLAVYSFWDAPSVSSTSGHNVLVAKTGSSTGMSGSISEAVLASLPCLCCA
jgi:hypothetical protein